MLRKIKCDSNCFSITVFAGLSYINIGQAKETQEAPQSKEGPTQEGHQEEGRPEEGPAPAGHGQAPGRLHPRGPGQTADVWPGRVLSS